MGSMSFLPQKFARSQKWLRAFYLSPQDIVPQVQQNWKIPPTSDPLRIKIINDCFRSRSDGKSLAKFILPRMSHPKNLRVKPLEMIGFFLQQTFWNQKRKVCILVASFFNLRVKKFFYSLPNFVGIFSKNHGSLDRGI